MDSQPASLPDFQHILASHSNLSFNLSAVTLDDLNLTFDSGDEVDKILEMIMGAKRKDIRTVVPITVVYTAIFLTGVIGNICTCIVIAWNAYMRTVTNYYLFSLAISDVLTLIVGEYHESNRFSYLITYVVITSLNHRRDSWRHKIEGEIVQPKP